MRPRPPSRRSATSPRRPRAVRARGLLVGSLAVTGSILACASSPPPAPPPASGGEATAPAPVASEDVVKSADAGAATPEAPAHAAKIATPTSFDQCKSMKPENLLAVITNEPDGGLCMNNAQTSADAGSTDRCAGVVDVMEAHRDAFRCCYDLYARAHQNAGAHVVLHIELAADGTMRAASLNQPRSTLSAPEIESCMVAVTQTIAFPKSPSGRQTELDYPFDFKARS